MEGVLDKAQAIKDYLWDEYQIREIHESGLLFRLFDIGFEVRNAGIQNCVEDAANLLMELEVIADIMESSFTPRTLVDFLVPVDDEIPDEPWDRAKLLAKEKRREMYRQRAIRNRRTNNG